MKEKHNIQNEGDKYRYKDTLKKNKLLMGLTELLFNEMNPVAGEKKERAGGFKASKNKENPKPIKTIGFVFFNSNIILEPNSLEKEKGRVQLCPLTSASRP